MTVQDDEGEPERLQKCHRHTGADCELCGGSGWRRQCRRRDCIEYGCDGGTYCFISTEDAAALGYAATEGADG